jgi:uncharacterized membrane protein HdeD (DUF308 family)
VGIGGFVAHFSARGEPDWVWVEITELLAIVCGIFLLRGNDWARWLAGAWMAVHVVLFGLIVWGLFRADADRFFRETRPV